MPQPRLLSNWPEWLTPAAILVSAPFLLFPDPRWIWMALLVPLVLVVRWAAKGGFVPGSPLNLLLLLLAVTVAVSLAGTFDLRFSLGKLAGTLLGIYIFLGAAQFVDCDRRLGAIVALLCAGSVALALLSLVGTQWKARLPVLRTVASWLPVRFQGLPGAAEGFHPNAVAGTLILTLPLFFLVARHLARRSRTHGPRHGHALTAAFYASLALTLFVLVLSESRGAWLGLTLATLSVLAIHFPRFRIPILAGGAMAGILAAFNSRQVWDRLLELDQASAAQNRILPGRLELWSTALKGIQDFPFTGMGLNGFRRVANLLYPSFADTANFDVASSHNQMLQTALDIGIPGMAIYMALWVALLRMLWLVSRRSKDPFRRIAAVGLKAGLLAQFFFLITDSIPLGAKVGAFFWMACGVAAALYRLEFGDRPLGKKRCAMLVGLWALASLASISLIGQHPHAALAVALGSGALAGLWSVNPAGQLDRPAS